MIEILLIGAGMLLCTLVCFAVATVVVVRTVARLLPGDGADVGFWKGLGIMTVVTLTTTVMHLVEIYLWAIVYRLCGEMATFESAFYFSAVNYTALGYGDLVLAEGRRLLGPLEAINGLLLIGLSTAGMFVVLNRLIPQRLRREA